MILLGLQEQLRNFATSLVERFRVLLSLPVTWASVLWTSKQCS